MNRVSKCLVGGLLLFFLVCFFWSPPRYLAAFSEGVSLWAISVLPSTFPFLFAMTLLSDLGLLNRVASKLSPLFRFLFGVSGTGGCIFVLSALSGYPVGAKLVAESVKAGRISRKEGEKLAPICSSCSPLFLLGCAGNLFSSKAVGWLLVLANFLAVFLSGILFRFRKGDTQSRPLAVQRNGLSESMTSSLLSVLFVGGYIALFSCLSAMLTDLPFLALSPMGEGILRGLVEMTMGCKCVATLPFGIPLCAFFTTFGGACILLQQATFLSSAKVKLLPFLGIKLVQGILALLIALVGAYYL